MRRSRQGSILILCLAIVATLSMLVYGFLRVVQLHQESQNEMDKMLLAREAAQMGVNHAVEQIVRDYVTEPFTRMDGPARAPFVANDNPYQAMPFGSLPSGYAYDTALQRYTGNDLDDVSIDRLLHLPLFGRWFTGGYDGGFGLFNWAWSNTYPEGGMVNNDGRGCYIEPGWSNRFAGPTAAAPTKVRFGAPSSASAPTTTLPDLNADPNDSTLAGAIFYDEHFRRLPAATDARTNRMNARYRLRYAVTVTDLDGQLLINPDPAIDPSVFVSALPADYASPADARTIRSAHAIAPMIEALNYHGPNWGAGVNAGNSGGVKAEHLFLGRGFTGNFWQKAGSDAPCTWPLMWRKSTTTATPTFQYFVNNPATSGVPASPPYQDYAPQLFTMQGVSASVAGGQALPLSGKVDMYKLLVGPQYSFFNFDMAEFSGMNDEALDWGRAWQRDGTVRSLGCLTPFGRGLSRTQGAASTTPSRFSGPVDTPWAVNVLTAPVQVVSAMIFGYMPPGALAMFTEDMNTKTPYWMSSRSPRDLFVKEINPGAFASFAGPVAAVAPDSAVKPNYHVQHTLPTEPGYRAPKDCYPGEIGFNGVLSTGIWTNDTLGYYLRASAGATPGTPKPVCTTNVNGCSVSGEGNSIGAYDPYSANPFGKITYSYNSPPLTCWLYLPTPGDWKTDTNYNLNDNVKAGVNIYKCSTAGKSAASGTGPTGTGTGIADGTCTWDFVGVVPKPTSLCYVMNHPDSAWRAIAQAMSTAVAMARARTMSLNTSASAPAPITSTSFATAPSWPFATPVATIADVDRLFLANLGIDISSPSGASPTTAWYGNFSSSATATGMNVTYTSFTPGWNLASLYANLPADSSAAPGPGQIGFPPDLAKASSADFPNAPYTKGEYTAVTEMLINDFRVSFFGCNPAYTTFQALDLNGDGKVTCSALGANGAATLREQKLHIDCWTGGAAAAVVPANMFCHTGCFTMTKSHFWRIMSRGEVWDNFYKTVVGQSELDTVICVDPLDEAHEDPSALPKNPALGQYSTHVIYQRRVHDLNRSSMSARLQ